APQPAGRSRGGDGAHGLPLTLKDADVGKPLKLSSSMCTVQVYFSPAWSFIFGVQDVVLSPTSRAALVSFFPVAEEISKTYLAFLKSSPWALATLRLTASPSTWVRGSGLSGAGTERSERDTDDVDSTLVRPSSRGKAAGSFLRS